SNLENTLRGAAMKDKKTVIITAVNSAWTREGSVVDLFLESFRSGIETKALLNHLVVVCLDRSAYDRCLEIHRHCYALTTAGVDFSGEKPFMSADYLKMMWRRNEFLIDVLELGHHFVFSDADVVWLRNPFPRFFAEDEGDDIQFSCEKCNYNSTDRRNSPNAGFKYVRSNHKTIEFYRFWFEAHHLFPGERLQKVLWRIKFDPIVDRLGLRMRFLDTRYFDGLCEPNSDMDSAVTMHAICCFGAESKIGAMKMVIDDWKRYKTKNSS
ncbi:hypothetical protein M569_11119, partial [Genlisea aurea]